MNAGSVCIHTLERSVHVHIHVGAQVWTWRHVCLYASLYAFPSLSLYASLHRLLLYRILCGHICTCVHTHVHTLVPHTCPTHVCAHGFSIRPLSHLHTCLNIFLCTHTGLNVNAHVYTNAFVHEHTQCTCLHLSACLSPNMYISIHRSVHTSIHSPAQRSMRMPAHVPALVLASMLT